jgi:hypothetical protein
VKRALEASARPSAPAPRERARSADGELATPTLAELYLKQGHPDKAADVYRAILERDAANLEVRASLAALEKEQALRAARRAVLEQGIARLERLLLAVGRARRA